MSSHKQHQHLTAPQVPSRPSLSQSKTHNEPLKRLSIMETILSILIFATFFCVYMIIPSITINYYYRNNLTSDSNEYVDYILAIVCIIIIFVCIIGFLVLNFFQISSWWIRVFIWICVVIHCYLSIMCLIKIHTIIDKKFGDDEIIDPNKKIDSSYKFLWICIVVIIVLPFFTEYQHHIQSR